MLGRSLRNLKTPTFCAYLKIMSDTKRVQICINSLYIPVGNVKNSNAKKVGYCVFTCYSQRQCAMNYVRCDVRCDHKRLGRYFICRCHVIEPLGTEHRRQQLRATPRWRHSPLVPKKSTCNVRRKVKRKILNLDMKTENF